MKITISTAMSFVFITFCTVLFISVMNFSVSMQKVNDYHYATVHEIESSDFASAVINERKRNSDYTTMITQKSIKEDMRIYEVKTTAELSIPILNYHTTYTKVSTAR